MVNSYTARGNGRAVKQHDTSGVRHKKFEDGDVDEEGVDGRTADPNFSSSAHRTHVTDIEKKRPSAAGNYGEGGDAFAKVRGKLWWVREGVACVIVSNRSQLFNHDDVVSKSCI